MANPLPLPEHLDHLAAQLPPSGLAVLTDIDGTISAIAPTPDDAAVDPACRGALKRLAGLLPLVGCLSGRPAAQAAAMVGVLGMQYAGSHGLDYLVDGKPVIVTDALPYLDDLRQAVARLDVTGISGVLVEHKPAGVALHYRAAPDPELAKQMLGREIDRAVGTLRLRVKPGRRVLEVVPDVLVDKGTAARRLLAAYDCSAAMYLGDDITDIDAFRALHMWAHETGRVALRVAVATPETPPDLLAHADYVVQGVPGVATVLSYLADRYSPAATAAAP